MNPRIFIFATLLLMFIGNAALNGSTTSPPDTATALQTLKEQADSGNAEATYRLAYIYENGLAGIEKDTTEAIKLYHRSAQQGYAPAQNYLGFCYYRGCGVERNPDEALKWIQLAADNGDAKSYNNLGWLLLEGEGIIHDARKAAYWFERAAEKGVITAQSQLADLYKTGNGVPVDTLKADSLYHKAMQGGLKDAERKLLAMNYNSYCLLSADSALTKGKTYYYDSHFLLAATLFEIAAEKGNIRAKTFLGECYAHAFGVNYDFEKALACYYEAAIEGDGPAQFIIAETIEMMPDILEILPPQPHHPQSTTLNPLTEAAYWYEKAALQGITNADEATKAMSQ